MSESVPPKPDVQANLQPGAQTEPRVERREVVRWLWRLPVLAALGGAGWGVWEAYRVHFSKVDAGAPAFVPLTPQRVAGLNELAEPWSAVTFELQTAAGTTPALVLNVPEAVPGGLGHANQHFLAFSRVCTHQGCPVGLQRDLETLAVAFNYRTDAPALACPCHLSVFAPLQAGRAVSGPAREPLPRVQLEARGTELWAVGLEPPAQLEL